MKMTATATSTVAPVSTARPDSPMTLNRLYGTGRSG